MFITVKEATVLNLSLEYTDISFIFIFFCSNEALSIEEQL